MDRTGNVTKHRLRSSRLWRKTNGSESGKLRAANRRRSSKPGSPLGKSTIQSSSYSMVPKFCVSKDGMPPHALVIGGDGKIFRVAVGRRKRLPHQKSSRVDKPFGPLLGVGEHHHDYANREQAEGRQQDTLPPT